MSGENRSRFGSCGRRRLVLCFDGTWNTPESHTNVSRLYAALADDGHTSSPTQLKFYDAGVGTSFESRLRGGAFGVGLVENILEGYAWLVNHYRPTPEGEPKRAGGIEDGDEIYLFGFSRGAFTARSLAGLVNRCGIVRRELLPAGTGGEAGVRDSALVGEAWSRYRLKSPDGRPGRDLPEVAGFRREKSWDVGIKLIAVWDTVGALGVPQTVPVPAALRRDYGFHDTALGVNVEHALQAAAIDEHRPSYDVNLWSACHAGQRVEQRWFPGAHANVGGGYEEDLLPDLSLRWIAEQARGLGVTFMGPRGLPPGQGQAGHALPPDFTLTGIESLSPVRDSYSEFALGVPKVYLGARALLRYALGGQRTVSGRHYRPMLVGGVGESIDPSAHQKWQADARYRPPNLAAAGRSLGPGGGMT